LHASPCVSLVLRARRTDAVAAGRRQPLVLRCARASDRRRLGEARLERMLPRRCAATASNVARHRQRERRGPGVPAARARDPWPSGASASSSSTTAARRASSGCSSPAREGVLHEGLDQTKETSGGARAHRAGARSEAHRHQPAVKIPYATADGRPQAEARDGARPSYAGASPLPRTWPVAILERRLPEELSAYARVVAITHRCARGFSSAVITPDVTTLDDLDWCSTEGRRPGARALVLHDVSLIRQKFLPLDRVIRPGDVLHCDIGVSISACTATFRDGVRAARARRRRLPDSRSLRRGNRMQDILIGEFKHGASGNECRRRAGKGRPKARATRSHASIGLHGHAAARSSAARLPGRRSEKGSIRCTSTPRTRSS